MDYSILYVTAGSLEEARSIARLLVEERLVACANVLPGMTSFFFWEGKAQEEPEVVAVFKTRSDLVDRATARICELHSYTCPCVVALPITSGNAAFLDWIGTETAPPSGRAAH